MVAGVTLPWPGNDPHAMAWRPGEMSTQWREHNAVELLPEADRFLPALFEAVAEAQESVLVELYLMESGELANRVIEALVDAAARGWRSICCWMDSARWGCHALIDSG